jgi:Ran GTPase-activating protein (RanGAP) involved in mRNA processing and transport
VSFNCVVLILSLGETRPSLTPMVVDRSRKGMVALGKTFGHSKNLRQLILSRNEKIGDEGVQAFNEAISDTNDTILESLEILDLASCEIGANGVEALSKLLNRCSIRSISLTLTSNPLRSASCAALSTTLCGTSKVTSLYLSHCDIGDDGLKLLLASQQCTNEIGLTVLDLSHNGIGPEGATTLASALWDNGESRFKNLNELVLTGNALGYIGVQCLGNALAHRNKDGNFEAGNETLEILDLTQTDCGKDGAVAIMRCSHLKRVRLFNNQLADIGGNKAKINTVIQVLDAVGTINTEIDSKLNTLEIGGNETGLDVEEAIKRVKTTRPELDVARDKPNPQQEAEADPP